MSRSRRLAASVLFILMVPSLVLAATPLRYCMGPSGHQALEFVVDGVAHSGSHASHGQTVQDVDGCNGAASSSAFVDGGKCIDRALMDTASAPPSVDLKLLPLSGLFGQVFVPPPAALSVSLVQGFVPFDRLRQHADPRMEVRRTVVLLI
jgi:hypothetical protein